MYRKQFLIIIGLVTIFAMALSGCAPAQEEIPEDVQEELPENVQEEITEDIQEEISEDVRKIVVYDFPGISVLVPTQIEQCSKIVPLDWRDQIPDDIPNETDRFTLIRYVANIVLFCEDQLIEENFESPIQEFNPPIAIRVSYTQDDIEEVDNNLEDLKLAYWDQEKWVIISDPSYEYQILPPSTAQIAEVKIWSWTGDPPLGWGK